MAAFRPFPSSRFSDPDSFRFSEFPMWVLRIRLLAYPPLVFRTMSGVTAAGTLRATPYAPSLGGFPSLLTAFLAAVGDPDRGPRSGRLEIPHPQVRSESHFSVVEVWR